MKNKTSIKIGLFALLICLGSVVAFAQTSTLPRPPATLKVLCTTFPMYQFTRMVAEGRDGLEVRLMLPATLGCPHDYSLTTDDMRTLAKADVLIANGLGMENFLGKAVQQANPKLKIADSSKGIKNLIALHEDEEEHDHAHEKEGAHHHHDSGMNPHLFASPLQAAQVVRNIAQELSKLDPDGAMVYAANAKKYGEQLEALAKELETTCAAFTKKKIVTEHAVFDYLARDAGLQIAAVVEEEPGQEPAASEMLKIITTIKKSGAAVVFTEPQYPAKVGETIAKEAQIPVASLDPVATGPMDAPLDYYEKTMRANLETLKKYLR
ncbi:TPA: ABC transporter substrate-binding protein [Candidatus Sumerlaeota bacterium]|nr:ABC transporter substrate-binding protein [Candidatus Sumerlaeota bacterium]